ncbi:MAG TPA: MFS transporter, partial [Gaiellaceae bacterium]|nr:MFS transporter [Gaiellaceae bacterium]
RHPSEADVWHLGAQWITSIPPNWRPAVSIALPFPRTATPRDAVRRILGGNVLSLVGDGMLLPFAALYFIRAFGFSPAGAALVFAAMTGGSVVLTAPGGVVLDRLGTARASAAATLLQAAACVGLAFASSLTAAVAMALVFAAGRAVSRPGVDAIVAQLTEGQERTNAFAALNVATNVGLGAGAALGGALATLGTGGLRWLFIADAASYFLFAVVLRGAPEVVRERGVAHGGYAAVLRDRAFLRILAITFVAFVGLTQIDVSFPLYTVSTVGLPIGIVGIAGLANTVVVVALQGQVMRRTAAIARHRLIAVGAAGLALCWGLSAAASFLPGTILPAAALVAALATMGIAETALIPVLFATANELAPDALRGRYNALLWAAIGAAFAAGPLAGGALVGAGLSWAWLLGLAGFAASVAALGRRVEG